MRARRLYKSASCRSHSIYLLENPTLVRCMGMEHFLSGCHQDSPFTIVAMTLPEANMSLERTTAALSSASFVEAVPWAGTTIMKGPPYTI